MYHAYRQSCHNQSINNEERKNQIEIVANIMKTFKNFSSSFINTEKLLNEDCGTAIINEFKELPKALEKRTSSLEVEKWYQYRLRTKIYHEKDDYYGSDGIIEYAIKLSIGDQKEIFHSVYFCDRQVWVRADDCEVKIDKDNEVRIAIKDPKAAKDSNYKPLHLEITNRISNPMTVKMT